jgi:amino acid adenylation domain-containing protein
MMLVHHLLRHTASTCPGQLALIVGDQGHSFRFIDRASDRLACALQRMGVARGDRVAVMIENSAEMVISLWGVLKAGAVFVPVNHTTKVDKLAFILEDSGAHTLIAPAQLNQRVLAAAKQVVGLRGLIWVGDVPNLTGPRFAEIIDGKHDLPTDPGLIDQDLCLLIYTSGSTGRPKGVMMTHRNIHNNIWSISTYLGNVPSDIVLCVLPLSFDYGLFQILTGARVGFTVVLERSFAYPYEVLKQIARHKVTGLPGVPTIFATLLQFAPFTGLDLSSLRYLSNTAAAFPPAHIRRLRELLPQATIFSMFGLTECTRVSYLDPAKLESKITSVGQGMPNSETYIVDDDGHRLPPGEIGELVIRGTSVMRGYWRRPEDTARALRSGEIPGEMVLYSGDLFRMDEDGDLYFIGRKDDVFKCRGEKVSPKEVENVLYELPEIAEAAVIGVPDSIDGMAIKAFVVAREGHSLTEQTLRKYCRGRLEPQLVPKFFELCSALPKTDSGKITKSVIRALAGSAGQSLPPADS